MTHAPGSAEGRYPDGVVIGIDVGTSAVKAIASRPGGRHVGAARIEHEVDRTRAGWAEQDAEAAWWHDVARACRQVITSLPDRSPVLAAGVTTIGPCVVPVDGDGRPLRPGILYGVDGRASAELDELAASGWALTTQHVGPKILWVHRHEPEVAAATARWHTATSFVVERLTGRAVIDRHQAAAFAPFHGGPTGWMPDVVPGVDLTDRLPETGWPGDIAGHVTAEAAAFTGLPLGTPVMVGTSDGPMEAHGVGAGGGIAGLALGQTAVLSTLERPDVRTPLGMWGSDGWHPEHRWIGGALSTGGAAIDWLLGLLPTSDEARAGSPRAGAGGILVLPHLLGMRTPAADPLLRGAIVGLDLTHTGADLRRAMLEGVAFGIRDLTETMRAAGIPIVRLRSTGGGTRDSSWLQVISDVTGLPQDVLDTPSGAAAGAARLAGASIGWPDQAGTPWSRIAGTVEPEPSVRDLHERQFAAYRDLTDAIRRLTPTLAVVAEAAQAARSDRP
jgi:xylulokinase